MSALDACSSPEWLSPDPWDLVDLSPMFFKAFPVVSVSVLCFGGGFYVKCCCFNCKALVFCGVGNACEQITTHPASFIHLAMVTNHLNVPISHLLESPIWIHTHHSRRFMDPPGSWMIPEDHPSVGSVREEQSRVSSWAMTEHSHPSSSRSPSPRHSHAHSMQMALPYMISPREAFLPSVFPGKSSSCSSSTCRHQLLSISGLRHGWKGSLKPSAISLLLPDMP